MTEADTTSRLLYQGERGFKVRTVPIDCVRSFLCVDLLPMGLCIHIDERSYSTTNISGSTVISDFTELATRLYFWGASKGSPSSRFHRFFVLTPA